MKVQGKLLEKMDTRQVSAKLSKREFVLEIVENNPMYPEFVKFELINDKTDIIDAYQEGQKIEVDFNLKGRPWTNPQGVKSYFNSLRAWKIQPIQGEVSKPVQQQQSPTQTDEQRFAPVQKSPVEDDDLPF